MASLPHLILFTRHLYLCDDKDSTESSVPHDMGSIRSPTSEQKVLHILGYTKFVIITKSTLSYTSCELQGTHTIPRNWGKVELKRGVQMQHFAPATFFICTTRTSSAKKWAMGNVSEGGEIVPHFKHTLCGNVLS